MSTFIIPFATINGNSTIPSVSAISAETLDAAVIKLMAQLSSSVIYTQDDEIDCDEEDYILINSNNHLLIP